MDNVRIRRALPPAPWGLMGPWGPMTFPSSLKLVFSIESQMLVYTDVYMQDKNLTFNDDREAMGPLLS